MQITVCDEHETAPARTFTISVDGGEPDEVDLCEQCARPLLDLIAKRRARESDAAAEPAPASSQRSAPARARKKAAAKKATATKSAAGRRAPRVTTMAEIEAKKQAAAEKDEQG
ncbi:hypothetical protein [Streptomyces sp. NPDC047097]|uniref:hypothetical protein n=1 Tax=Streptomyces sp. NPDC047097 TaxID=3155260 RepID=UPI0033F829B5